MNRKDLYDKLEELAPLELQDSWDNSGPQIETGRGEIKRVLAAMEITYDVIDEAEAMGADMIITHHPLFFSPVKSLSEDEIPGGYALRLIRAGISVYSMHTCYDNAPRGMNDLILEAVGASVKGCAKDSEGRDIPCLKMGRLREPRTLSEIFSDLGDYLLCPDMRLSGTGDDEVSVIAVCTGAGGSFWKEALDAGAELFITGEIRHHEAQPASELGLNIISAGHWGTEHIFSEALRTFFENNVSGVQLVESTVAADPFIHNS